MYVSKPGSFYALRGDVRDEVECSKIGWCLLMEGRLLVTNLTTVIDRCVGVFPLPARLRIQQAARVANQVTTTLGESCLVGSIFAANVWTAILPPLIRKVSAANTMSADAQFACHTM